MPNEKQESWEKECLATFFVYNMKRGKHGDHVGAQNELIEFIRTERRKAAEEAIKVANLEAWAALEEIKLRDSVYHAGASDFSEQIIQKGQKYLETL